MAGYYYKIVRSQGKQIGEHRLIVEKKLGRKLRLDEYVHHKDGNIQNNEPNNLMIVSPSEHDHIHKSSEHARIYKRSFPSVCLIKMLRGYVEKTGIIPTARSLQKIDWLPSQKPFVRRFGSWNNALKAAGLPIREPFGFAKIRAGLSYKPSTQKSDE